MKPQTRDNVIYLVIGLTIAALLAADAFYADAHDREMWMPSEFAFHTLAYMGLLCYFVAKEAIKMKASLVQTVICVLVASVLHLGTAFAFHQTYAGRLSPRLFGLALLEFFVILQLVVHFIRYLQTGSNET